MTINIPKWALWTAAGVLAAAAVTVAFLIGRSSSSSSTSSSSPDEATSQESSEEPEAVEAPCNEREAQRATLRSEFDDAISETARARGELSGYPTPPTEVTFKETGSFRVAVLECVDLTGDGLEEMIVALSAGASGSIFQWAVFEPNKAGEWKLAFHREGSQVRSLGVDGNLITVKIPLFEEGAPTCCPTGSRTSSFEYTNGRYKAVGKTSTRERLIRVADGSVVRLGPLDTYTVSGADAIQAFGEPTSITDTGEICEFEWSDLGLVINFVDLGGLAACGPDGRIGSIELVGSTAEQAGWKTTEGTHVGMPLAEVRATHPDLSKSGGAYELSQRATGFGEAGVTPSVTARVANGEVIAMGLYVGAGGE
jgi:hypothetical protein